MFSALRSWHWEWRNLWSGSFNASLSYPTSFMQSSRSIVSTLTTYAMVSSPSDSRRSGTHTDSMGRNQCRDRSDNHRHSVRHNQADSSRVSRAICSILCFRSQFARLIRLVCPRNCSRRYSISYLYPDPSRLSWHSVLTTPPACSVCTEYGSTASHKQWQTSHIHNRYTL